MDYLLDSKFGMPSHRNEEGKIIAERLPPTPLRTLWTPNDFHYNFSEGIQHNLYW